MTDDGAGDRRALLLAARQHRRIGVDAIAEADPIEEFDYIGAIARLGPPDDAQSQGDILIGGEMVEQPEILKDDTDAPTDTRQIIGPDCR